MTSNDTSSSMSPHDAHIAQAVRIANSFFMVYHKGFCFISELVAISLLGIGYQL